jgi:C4-type Zn-finger protein
MAKKAKQKRVICPECGDTVQATVKVDAEVDPDTGEIVASGTGGSIELYCAADCGWRSDIPDFDGDWADERIEADAFYMQKEAK